MFPGKIQDVTPLGFRHMLVFVPPLRPCGLEFLKQFIQVTLTNHLGAGSTNFTILNRVNPDPDIFSMNDRNCLPLTKTGAWMFHGIHWAS
jgi:hypothetical protein